MQQRLLTRLHWNEPRMRDLFLQVSRRRRFRIDSVGLKIRGGVVDLSGFLSQEEEAEPAWTDILDAVVGCLRDSGQLLAIRPETLAEFEASEAEYVYEFVRATKLHLPVDPALVGDGLPPELTVWVADPPKRTDEPRDRWDFFGTYLFLVEEGDPDPTKRREAFFSGVSALAKLVRMARGDIDRDAMWRLGREEGAHPIEKLTALGARASLERDIEVLYQVRYMTDEQGGWSVSDGRVNDLLAYPLAIMSSTN
jgi:hypothetical protein